MSPIFTIAGLAGAYGGILVMLRYDLPYHLPPLPSLMRALTETEATEGDRRDLIGCGGVLVYTLGVAFQIFGVLSR